jgi:di/tricarboxylate transporter
VAASLQRNEVFILPEVVTSDTDIGDLAVENRCSSSISPKEGSLESDVSVLVILLPFLVVLVTSLAVTSLVEPLYIVTFSLICLMQYGILDKRDFLDSINWDRHIAIASALGIGIALKESGMAAFLATCLHWLIEIVPPIFQTPFLISTFYQVSWWISQFITNHSGAATSVLLFPITNAVANTISQQPHQHLSSTVASMLSVKLACAICIGSSSTFLTSYNHPTILLILGAGNYKLSDVLQLGGPLQILLWLSVVLFLSIT